MALTPDTITPPKTKHKPKLAHPQQYKVLLHNDDFTPRSFVVVVLQLVFHMSESQAMQLTQYVHQHGVGVCGVYPYEVAEMKIHQVHELAAEYGYPLMCSMQEV